MESVAEDVLREILLKLPTRDVVRCHCVSRRWQGVVGDASFKAAHVVVSGRSEVLLVSQKTPPGRSLVTNVFNVSSAGPTPMCSLVGLAEGYRPVNVCDGFLLLDSGVEGESLLVCNPVTREELRIPAPPEKRYGGQHLAKGMGFSYAASTHQYKIFRIPLSEPYTSACDNYLDVYTLGGGRKWRRHTDRFHEYQAYLAGSPPVLIDGKLYMLTRNTDRYKTPVNIEVIDVAWEMHGTYSLMPLMSANAAMDVMELDGRPHVAVHVLNNTRAELRLWAMPPPRVVSRKGQRRMHKKLPGDWELRYTFFSNRPKIYNSLYDDPRGVWVDGDGMLCCVMGYHLYKHNTTNEKEHKLDCSLAWDHQVSLPHDGNHRWSIYGGYRPGLRSLYDLDVQHEEDGGQFEHALLHALRTMPKDHHRTTAVTTDKHTAS